MGRHCLAIVATVALAACYGPVVPQDVICTPPNGNCPEGQVCAAQGMCVDIGSEPPDAARQPDARLVDAPHVAAWHLVQSAGSAISSSVGASLTTSIAPTSASDLIVVGVQFTPGATVMSVTDNGMSEYGAVTGTLATVGTGDGGIEIWYTQSVGSGVTSVTATTTSGAYAVAVWEIATAQPATVDVAAELSAQASSLHPASPMLTTANAGELVIAIGISEGVVSGIHAGNEFTNDQLLKGNGWAHITSTTSPAGAHRAVWDSTAGTFCSDAVAFHVGE
jgi:hypothetical protein